MISASGIVRIPGWRYGDVWFERVGLERDELIGLVRNFYEQIFSEFARTRGSSRWGEKTPVHVFHMELMAEVFPTANFVGITRHPAAVVSSMATSWQRDTASSASYWRRATTELIRVGQLLGDERFVLVRYEDLVSDPEPVLRDVCERVGLDWDESVLRHDEVQRSRGGPARTDGATDPQRGVDTAALSAWTERLDDYELGAVSSETGELAGWLGYDPTRPVPRPLEHEGSRCWTLSASVLQEMSTRPGSPDFTPQTEDPLDLEVDVRTLAERAARAERDLADMSRRRAVRAVDAYRRAQREGVAATLRRIAGGRRSGQQ